MLYNDQGSFDIVHEYSKQACLALRQVEDVCIVNEMELTVTAVEGHTFTIPLMPLHEKISAMQDVDEAISDEDIIYYFGKKVNEALGYKHIWPTDVMGIYPIMKNTAFIHGLSDAQRKEVVHQGFEGDLWICYGLYRDAEMHYLTHEQLKYTLGLATEDLHPVALENLERVQIENVQVEIVYPSIWHITHDVKYADDAGTLLFGSFWQGALSEFDVQSIAVTVPHADCILLCDASDQKAMDELRPITEKIYSEADDPLSKCIYWWNPENHYWQTNRYMSILDRLKMRF